MDLIYFARETYCVYRYQGMPKEVAHIKTQMETMKYRIVSSHKENIVPTEQDIMDLKTIANDEFLETAEYEFTQRVKGRKLRVVN